MSLASAVVMLEILLEKKSENKKKSENITPNRL